MSWVRLSQELIKIEVVLRLSVNFIPTKLETWSIVCYFLLTDEIYWIFFYFKLYFKNVFQNKIIRSLSFLFILSWLKINVMLKINREFLMVLIEHKQESVISVQPNSFHLMNWSLALPQLVLISVSTSHTFIFYTSCLFLLKCLTEDLSGKKYNYLFI